MRLRSLRLTAFTLFVLGSFTAGAGGCVIPKTIGDGSESGDEAGDETDESGGFETDDTGETGETGGSGDPSDGSGEAGSTGAPSTCEDLPQYQCEGPYDCGGFPCGTVFDWFDADGCMRRPCGGTEDCDPGDVCFTPLDYGGCVSSGVDCSPGPGGSCMCGADADCNGSFCVPESEVPM